MIIRPARLSDLDDMWSIFRAVVAAGDTYAFAPNTGRSVAADYFLGHEMVSWVAEVDERVVGMYKLVPNRPDLGSHVANASFMVHPDASGGGIGRALGLHCLQQARAAAFVAMQFNFVVSTNTRAVALWQGLGFTILATLPAAFQHQQRGLVDAYVMYRPLDDVAPVFGQPERDVKAVPRDSAYAVIRNQDLRVAVVLGREGVLLPGGGLDVDETVEAAVLREVAEECALNVTVERRLGAAVQYVYSQHKRTWFEKRSVFYAASAGESLRGRQPEHEVKWLSKTSAWWALTCESHKWALGI